MIMQANIVLGLGYGDEGKGITTDFLCNKAIENKDKKPEGLWLKERLVN